MSEDIHKWTRGRYVLMFDEHTFFVYDNEKEERMTALETTKRLNMQQATIEQLQKKLSECQGHKLELTPIPISRPITLKEAEDSIRVTKYEELFDDE